MADELISRQAVLELGYWHGKRPDIGNPYGDGVDAVDSADIEALPAADVSTEIAELKADNQRLRDMWAKAVSELSQIKARLVPCEECENSCDCGDHLVCTTWGCPCDADEWCSRGKWRRENATD